MLGPSLLAGVGLGICFVTVATAATSGVAPHEAGLASGLISTSRQYGGSIGLAVLVTIAGAVTRAAPTPERCCLPRSAPATTGRSLVAGALIAVAAITVAVFLPRRTDAD